MDYRTLRQRPQASALRTNGSAQKLDALRVIKRLSIGTRGTARWLGQFGDKLVCVRYREDPTTGTRLTTVELIVDERAPTPRAKVLVPIGIEENALRKEAIKHGAKWDSKRKLWRLTLAAAEALGLIITKFPSMDTTR